MALREDNVRVAVGDLLHDQWTSGNTAGYTPNADPSDSAHIDVHLGHYDQEHGHPQIGLAAVSSARVKQTWQADGSGLANHHDGRIDATVYVGSEDDLPEHSQLLAEAIGDEVYDIVHDADRLVDAETGALLTETVGPLSEPVVQTDTDGPEARYRALVELGYRRAHQP